MTDDWIDPGAFVSIFNKGSEVAVKEERERCANVCKARAERYRNMANDHPDGSMARELFLARYLELQRCASEIMKG